MVERMKSIYVSKFVCLLARILNSFCSSAANGEEVSLAGERKQSSHLSQAQHGHGEAGKGST